MLYPIMYRVGSHRRSKLPPKISRRRESADCALQFSQSNSVNLVYSWLVVNTRTNGVIYLEVVEVAAASGR